MKRAPRRAVQGPVLVCAFFSAFLVAAGGMVRAATEKTSRVARKSRGDAKPAAAAALPADRLEALRGALGGADDEAAIEAAGALGASAAPNAAEPLIEVLAAGAAPARLQAVLDGLIKLGQAHALRPDQTTLDALALYAGHRATDIRKRAIGALATISDPRATPPLVERLGDAAPDVRAAAATALAERHEGKAAARMYGLLAQGDAGVAGPLAALATPDLIPRIAELAGTIDDETIAAALGEYVKRPDVPEKLRVDVLRTIGRLSGAVATTALADYLASVPAKEDRPSKHEAQKLLDQRSSN